MVRKRAALWIRIEVVHDFFRRFLAGAHAIGDSNTMIGAAGEGERGKYTQSLFGSFYAGEVSHMVLRHRVRMAPDSREDWPPCDSKQGRQFAADIFLHRRIIVLKKVGLQGAADESAQQQMVFRRSAGIFQATERARHDFPTLD